MTQVIAPFASRTLRAARAIQDGRGGPSFELTSKQLCVARHLAREGATAEEIHEALRLPCSTNTMKRKLKAANIHWWPKNRQAHRGQTTSLPPGHAASMRSYRPRGRE